MNIIFRSFPDIQRNL